MKYDEHTALELIARHNLSPTTLRVWKKRQSIPEKYATEDFSVRKKIIRENDVQAQQHLLRALNTGKLNVEAFGRLAGFSTFLLRDFKAGKTALSVQELTAAKKAINTLRNEVKALSTALTKYPMPEQSKKQLSHFVRRNEISFLNLLGGNRQAYDAFRSFAIGKNHTFPHQECIEILRKSLTTFLVESAI